MWWEWIQRAHKFGGLKVMVGLAHNSRTIAEHLGAGGPISGHVDDLASADFPQGVDLVDNHLLRSADYCWHTWQKIEAQKALVR